MARKIPDDFDVSKEKLVTFETIIRDDLKLNIENWAKFRYTINVGTMAKNLKGRGYIKVGVKDAYRELGKSHYEVVTSLGYAALIKTDFDNQDKIPL
ncbi:hypothetical protein KJ564_12215, partial [bacterium]|nr:hypothetical protein [bacterium]